MTWRKAKKEQYNHMQFIISVKGGVSGSFFGNSLQKVQFVNL